MTRFGLDDSQKKRPFASLPMIAENAGPLASTEIAWPQMNIRLSGRNGTTLQLSPDKEAPAGGDRRALLTSEEA